MAITKPTTVVNWSSVASKALVDDSVVASDIISIDATTVSGTIQVSCSTAGTPTSGDTVTFWAAYSSGDLLGDTGDDFDTNEYAKPLGIVDTFTTNTPGENPARTTLILPTVAAKSFKLLAAATANAATRNITIRAIYTEVRAA